MINKKKVLSIVTVSGLALSALGAFATPAIQNGFATHVVQAANVEIDNTSVRSITVHKYENTTPAGEQATGEEMEVDTKAHPPLANVPFSVVKVTAKDKTKPISVDNYVVVDGAVTQTGKTDAAGVHQFVLGTGTAADGYYLLQEHPSSAIETPMKDVIVKVPQAKVGVGASGFLYDVNLYPKNDLSDIELDLNKTFSDDDKVESAVKGDDLSWKLSANVPTSAYSQQDLNNDSDFDDEGETVYATEFMLVDPLYSKALTFDSVDGAIGVDEAGQKVTDLVEGTDYNVTANAGATGTSVEGYQIVQIDITDAGKKKLVEAGADKVEFMMNTTVNKDYDGQLIGNTFDVYYTPSDGNPGHETTTPPGTEVPGSPKDPNTPTVPTNPENPGGNTPTDYIGRVDLLKVSEEEKSTTGDEKNNDDNKPLAGAEFAIYTTKEAAQAGDAAIGTATSDTDGRVVFDNLVAFTDTNNDGKISETEQAAGPAEYYVVETKAPEGYEVDGVIHLVKATTDNKFDLTVVDPKSTSSDYPLTGGKGLITIMITASALIIIGGAGVYYSKNKKKEA
ncbi:SpaH/EbpB family LPXTG-anchored major pilin [Lapidilactobacillus mulanensis]|uniref:SpaH/EbpB family LPXTG-anchored major pilin n=1 Tax=Lapidilactobacillus mulanensis TaxID=2485999 RepID=A0ABW4DNP8_9LACO|nr:SpaH/EbpB family LPXTG-anchored major pilin [Lapidilactobacillus mulanensis]